MHRERLLPVCAFIRAGDISVSTCSQHLSFMIHEQGIFRCYSFSRPSNGWTVPIVSDCFVEHFPSKSAPCMGIDRRANNFFLGHSFAGAPVFASYASTGCARGDGEAARHGNTDGSFVSIRARRSSIRFGSSQRCPHFEVKVRVVST